MVSQDDSGSQPPHTLPSSLTSLVFQDVRCWRPEIRAEEVDSLFRRSDGHHLLRGAVRVRPGPGRGRGDEQVRVVFLINGSTRLSVTDCMSDTDKVVRTWGGGDIKG